MLGAHLTRAEAEARAAVVRDVSYEVVLDLTRGDRVFGADTLVRFDATEGAATHIDLVADRVHAVRLNGELKSVDAVWDGTRIRLDGLAEHNELHVAADGLYTNTGEGLHRFVDPVDGGVYLYTEMAVAQANRMFAVFDQPDLKASVRLTVTAPEDWQVLGNAPTPLPTEGLAEGTAVWEFAPGPVMSSYLVALIAGPYSVWRGTATTTDGRTIPLGLFARASLARYAEPEVFFETLQRGIRYYEAGYGVPYPYEKYDQIFVPEYNWGAMENIGAVTFNEAYLFRSKVSEARRLQRTIVILHELSHMWFGNLVTMKWWNDLWLNESFATWTSTMATAEVTDWGRAAWAAFTAIEKTDAARQDQLPSTHPIVAEIHDLADVEVNFDKITYDKGASVIRQLVAWVGLDAFHAGVHAYLTAHASGNATLRDLLGELERSSGRELTEWSRLWLETAGVNTLRADIETDGEGRITRFAVLQTPSTSSGVLRPHRIAIGFYDGASPLERVHRVELDVQGERTDVPELVGLARPALVLVNDDDLSYAKLRLDERSLATALERLDALADPVARALVWGSVWDAVRDAETPASAYVTLVLGNVAHETESTARGTALAQLELALARYLDPATAARQRADAGDALWALLELAEPGSDGQLQFAISFARVASTPAHADLLTGLLERTLVLDGLEIDTDLRWELVIALSALGAADDERIDAALALDDTAKGRQLAATARAARPDAGAKRAAFDAVATDETLSNDLARAIAAGWSRAEPASLVEACVEPYFTMLQSVWANRPFAMADIIVKRLFPAGLVEPWVADAARSWLAANDGPGPLVRLVSEGLSELERALAAQACDAQAALGARSVD